MTDDLVERVAAAVEDHPSVTGVGEPYPTNGTANARVVICVDPSGGWAARREVIDLICEEDRKHCLFVEMSLRPLVFKPEMVSEPSTDKMQRALARTPSPHPEIHIRRPKPGLDLMAPIAGTPPS
jgi:hypothetical protein